MRPRLLLTWALAACLLTLTASLLLTGGSAPAVEAQSFSGVTETPSGSVCEADVESETTDQEAGPCATRATSLTVSLFTDGTAALNRTVYVTGGTQLPKLKTYSSRIGNQRNVYQTSAPSLGKVGVNRHTLTFAADESSTKRSKTITVTKSMANHRGDVFLFVYNDSGSLSAGSDHLNSDIFGKLCLTGPNGRFDTPLANYPITGPSDCTGDDVFLAAGQALSLDGIAQFGIRVKFLDPPAVGRDGPDRNDVIEDFRQCVLGRNNTSGNYPSGITDKDGVTWGCDGEDGSLSTPDHAETDADDDPEIRSRLVAYVAESAAGAGDAAVSLVLDGSSADLILSDNQNSATVYAIINDQAGNHLLGEEVTFDVTSKPAGTVPSIRTTETTRSVISTLSTDPDIAATQFHFPGRFLRPNDPRNILNAVNARNSDGTFNNAAKISLQDNIYARDTLAALAIDNLPDSTFRVSVRVTADGVNIGTIAIARVGPLETVTATATADPCYVPCDGVTIMATATDTHGTKVNTSAFTVKPATATNWWESLSCVQKNDAVRPTQDEPAVGPDDATSPYCRTYASLQAGAQTAVDRAFGQRYGDVTEAFDITASGKAVVDSEVMFTALDDPPRGRYLLLATAQAGAVTKTDFVVITIAPRPTPPAPKRVVVVDDDDDFDWPADPRERHPEVYEDEQWGMSVSCEEEGRLVFDLGDYTPAVKLTVSLFDGEGYMVLSYVPGYSIPPLERNGQTASTVITTPLYDSRFRLSGPGNYNLLQGYADCRQDASVSAEGG